MVLKSEHCQDFFMSERIHKGKILKLSLELGKPVKPMKALRKIMSWQDPHSLIKN